MNTPLISVITVVYNGDKHLEQTIKSVVNQKNNNIEYIIVDGGSSDQTLDIIKRYDKAVDCWISEADSGIYNAMNKGILLSKGDYISFLQADDWYDPDAISKVVSSLSEDLDYVFGNVDILDGNDNFVKTIGCSINSYKVRMPFGYPALFVKRSILKHLNPTLIPINLKEKMGE